MASTNKTAHYELSQYVGSDKPTYLVDYNTDMSNIDTGIYNAKALADVNATSIGTLSNLETTVKTDLVSAVNEINTQVGLNTTAIGTNTDDIETNTTNIGDLTDLETTAKSNLVNAINEVESETNTNTANIGDLTNLETSTKSNLVSAINEVYQLKTTTLYDNSTGTTGNVTLSDDVSNYNYLEIYYTNSGKAIDAFTKYDIASGASIPLSFVNIGSSSMYIQSENATVSGTQITRGTGKGTTIDGTHMPSYYDVNITITKVIGIKSM